MKNFIYILLIPLLLSSCSNNDEPVPDVYSQVIEISNGESSQNVYYDDYGRVTEYVVTFRDVTVKSTYTYISDDLIKIYTENILHGFLYGEDAVTEYEDELHLENGRAKYCDGIYSTNKFGGDILFQKKYKHEFIYTPDNHLNVIKNTEWYKNGDSWAYDRPWSWENYYIWENNNLVSVEDYDGNQTPQYIYNYSYSSISGVQNILAVHYGRFQYFPLQLKGYFGSQPQNLIIGIESILPNTPTTKTSYEYNIHDNKITGYTETRGEDSTNYFVRWVE